MVAPARYMVVENAERSLNDRARNLDGSITFSVIDTVTGCHVRFSKPPLIEIIATRDTECTWVGQHLVIREEILSRSNEGNLVSITVLEPSSASCVAGPCYFPAGTRQGILAAAARGLTAARLSRSETILLVRTGTQSVAIMELASLEMLAVISAPPASKLASSACDEVLNIHQALYMNWTCKDWIVVVWRHPGAKKVVITCYRAPGWLPEPELQVPVSAQAIVHFRLSPSATRLALMSTCGHDENVIVDLSSGVFTRVRGVRHSWHADWAPNSEFVMFGGRVLGVGTIADEYYVMEASSGWVIIQDSHAGDKLEWGGAGARCLLFATKSVLDFTSGVEMALSCSLGGETITSMNSCLFHPFGQMLIEVVDGVCLSDAEVARSPPEISARLAAGEELWTIRHWQVHGALQFCSVHVAAVGKLSFNETAITFNYALRVCHV